MARKRRTEERSLFDNAIAWPRCHLQGTHIDIRGAALSGPDCPIAPLVGRLVYLAIGAPGSPYSVDLGRLEAVQADGLTYRRHCLAFRRGLCEMTCICGISDGLESIQADLVWALRVMEER